MKRRNRENKTTRILIRRRVICNNEAGDEHTEALVGGRHAYAAGTGHAGQTSEGVSRVSKVLWAHCSHFVVGGYE